MISYLIGIGVIITLVNFSYLIGINIFDSAILDIVTVGFGVISLFLCLLVARKKVSKLVNININVLKESRVTPVNVEYKPGKYSGVLKGINCLYYLGCLAPIICYLGSEVFVYYVEQPTGITSKISNGGLIFLWAVLVIFNACIPALYGKVKEAYTIYNTKDNEERSLRNGLAWEVTRNAQKLKLLIDLNKLSK